MTTHANATFTINTWEENAILETDGGSKITRATVSRLFEGDLEGEGNVECGSISLTRPRREPPRER
jgi:Protein of unknown function (DUF3224)